MTLLRSVYTCGQQAHPRVTFHVPFPKEAGDPRVTGGKDPSKGTMAGCCQTLELSSNQRFNREMSFSRHFLWILESGTEAVWSDCQSSEASAHY